MKNLIILIACFVTITSQAQVYSDATMDKNSGNNTFSDFARGDKLYTISYAGGVPLGTLSDFISGKLFDGLHFESRTFQSETFSLGLAAGFNSFRQKLPRATYQIQNGAYSSVQTRFLYVIPVLFQGTYHFPVQTRRFKPYAGLGVGGFAINYDQWDSTYPDSKLSIRFGGRGFIGTLIPIKETFGLNIAARYNLAIYEYNEIKNLNYAELAVGIYFLKY